MMELDDCALPQLADVQIFDDPQSDRLKLFLSQVIHM